MTVEQIDLQQIVQEFKAVDHKVKFTKNGSQWECYATYVGNIEEYKGSVTKGYGATEEAAANTAKNMIRRNKPQLFACRHTSRGIPIASRFA